MYTHQTHIQVCTYTQRLRHRHLELLLTKVPWCGLPSSPAPDKTRCPALLCCVLPCFILVWFGPHSVLCLSCSPLLWFVLIFSILFYYFILWRFILCPLLFCCGVLSSGFYGRPASIFSVLFFKQHNKWLVWGNIALLE